MVFCMVVSCMGLFTVQAADGDLLFSMDLTDYDDAAQTGIKDGSGNNVPVTIQEGIYVSGSQTLDMGNILKKSFINTAGTVVPYVEMSTFNRGGLSAGTINNCISVESADWANKDLTVEMWVNYEPQNAGSWETMSRIRGLDSSGSFVNSALFAHQSNGKSFETSGYSGSLGSSVSGKWVHFAYKRCFKDGAIIYSININGTNYNGGTKDTQVTETLARVLVGNDGTSNMYSPHILRVADLKVYEGNVSSDTIKAHYNAEIGRYTAAPIPTVTSVSPADGASVPTHGTDFVITFDTPVLESSLSGITLTGANGSFAPDAVTLSDDGCTATLSYEMLFEGDYTLAVTDGVKSALGVSAATSSYSYTAVPFSISEDFSDSEKWGAAGTVYTAAQLTEKSPYITAASTGSYTIGEDGSLILSAPKDNGATLYLNLGGAVKTGVITAEYKIKKDNGGGGSGSKTPLVYTNAEGSQTAKIINYGAGSGGYFNADGCVSSFAWDGAHVAVDADSYYRIKTVASRGSEAESWTIKTYLLDYSETKPAYTATRTNEQLGDIGKMYITLWCTSDTPLTMTVKDIHVTIDKYAINGVSVTDQTGTAAAAGFAGTTELNYSADVTRVGTAAVLVALYDGDTLEDVKIHALEAGNDAVTGTFTDYSLEGSGSVKVMLWGADLGAALPLADSLVY